MATLPIPSLAYWLFRASRVQIATKRNGPISYGFPGVEKVEPTFDFSSRLTSLTLYYNGGAGQLAVAEVEKSVKRGIHIVVIAKNISDMVARDFALIGAESNLIDFGTRPIRVFNLVSDGIHIHAILYHAGYGQVLDLKHEEAAARKKGVRGMATVYVLGDFEPPCARVNKQGRSYAKGRSKRDDIVEAGGYAIDLRHLAKHGCGSKVLAFALE